MDIDSEAATASPVPRPARAAAAAAGRQTSLFSGELSSNVIPFESFQRPGAPVKAPVETPGGVAPIKTEIEGEKFSRSADVGALLKRPELKGAIVMGDPDTMLEPVTYYADNPVWFLRQQRFGRVVKLAKNSRHMLSMTDVLSDMQMLHARTGRPVVFLSLLKLQDKKVVKRAVMFRDATILRPDDVRQFWANTRLVARLRPSASDEEYDVYVYPR